MKSLDLRAALVSLLLLLAVLGTWHVATKPGGASTASAGLSAEQIEYARMMGKDVGDGAPAASGGFPTLAQMGATAWHHLSYPFYDNGPNDKGIGLQLGYSLARVALG